jgi:endonuclease/exonuclease/phosphatase family metal-dependent hydrolase
MRVASVNVRRGLRNPDRHAGLERWVGRWAPDVLFLQEAVHSADLPPKVGGLRLLGGTASSACYGAIEGRVTTLDADGRIIRVEADGLLAVGCYFPHERSAARRRLFDLLSVSAAGADLICGDFNMAPREQDGMFGDSPSKWTGRLERRALETMFVALDLVDATAGEPAEPTFIQQRGAASIRFRCDLALVRRGTVSQVAVDHDTRIGPTAFTDHSGLIADLTRPNAA